MIPMFLCLQLVVLGCIISPCGSLSLTSEGISNEIWVIEEHSTVTLVCTISPYTSILMWRFNSLKVAECTHLNCRQISSGEGTFVFGFDTANGNFTWSIIAVDKKKHNGQLFECYDGANTVNVTALVKDSNVYSDSAENRCKPDEFQIVMFVFVLLSFVAATTAAAAVIITQCRSKHTHSGENGDNEIATILQMIKQDMASKRDLTEITTKVTNLQSSSAKDAMFRGIETKVNDVEKTMARAERVKEIHYEMQSLTQRTAKIEELVTRLETSVNDIVKEMARAEKVKEIQDKVQSQEKIAASLDEVVTRTETGVNDVEETMARAEHVKEIQDKVHDLESKTANLETLVTGVKTSVNDVVLTMARAEKVKEIQEKVQHLENVTV